MMALRIAHCRVIYTGSAEAPFQERYLRKMDALVGRQAEQCRDYHFCRVAIHKFGQVFGSPKELEVCELPGRDHLASV